MATKTKFYVAYISDDSQTPLPTGCTLEVIEATSPFNAAKVVHDAAFMADEGATFWVFDHEPTVFDAKPRSSVVIELRMPTKKSTTKRVTRPTTARKKQLGLR